MRSIGCPAESVVSSLLSLSLVRVALGNFSWRPSASDPYPHLAMQVTAGRFMLRNFVISASPIFN